MRSTRATAAVARLNGRSDAPSYRMIVTSTGLFKLSEQIGGSEQLRGTRTRRLRALCRFARATESAPHYEKRRGVCQATDAQGETLTGSEQSGQRYRENVSGQGQIHESTMKEIFIG